MDWRQSSSAVVWCPHKARDLTGSFHPGLGIVNGGEDGVVIVNGAADVVYNKHYLVGMILPAFQHVSKT